MLIDPDDAGRIRRSLIAIRLLWAMFMCASLPVTSNAQMDYPRPSPVEIGAQGIGVLTRESPAVGGREITEGYLTQPAIMAQLDPWGELLSLKGTLNLEGATLKRGELNAGIVGEGYIDRRHPHTYLHELVLSSAKRFGMDVARTA